MEYTVHFDPYTTHYSDVIMIEMTSQITIVYSTAYLGADQRKHQSSAPLAFVRGIHRWPVNSPHKGPVTRKMFPFDDVIMCEPCSGGWKSGLRMLLPWIKITLYMMSDISYSFRSFFVTTTFVNCICMKYNRLLMCTHVRFPQTHALIQIYMVAHICVIELGQIITELGQIMARHRTCSKPSTKLMLTYCQLKPQVQNVCEMTAIFLSSNV